jgi:hypothetical protein
VHLRPHPGEEQLVDQWRVNQMGCYPDAVLALACRYFHQMDCFRGGGLPVWGSGLARLPAHPWIFSQWMFQQWMFQVRSPLATMVKVPLLPRVQPRLPRLLQLLQLTLEP